MASQRSREAPAQKAKKIIGTAGNQKDVGPKCGPCGKTGRLTRTACCNQWICDDEDKYVMFSYARNSCSRNHRRLTLCGSHFVEGHEGDWRECETCRNAVELELYTWYGTNEYNFVKLENPPEYPPTRCAGCGNVIRLALEGYTQKAGGYYCERCAPFPRL